MNEYENPVNPSDLEKDWNDPKNDWWNPGEEVEVVDFHVDDAEALAESFSVETIFADPDKKRAKVRDKKPLNWARSFLDDCFFHADRHTLLKWRDEMYIWRRGAWRKASKDQIAKAVYLWGDVCSIEDDATGKVTDFNPNISKVREVMAASTALASIDDEIQMPSLLGQIEINPEMAVSLQNGIVDLRNSTLIPPTPLFFSRSCNKFDFDAKAPPPDQWLEFLSVVWRDDPKSIHLLQEIFGYLITTMTSYQKAFMIIGPRRSGKGTIARVLGELVGMDAIAAPTLASLSNNFGMENIIGKKVALVADARLSAKSDTAMIAERILSVTGEDIQSIDRKNISVWNGKIGARFIILSNMLPKFMDASGALASRMVILKMTKSFYGMEDPNLFEKLKPELPGIFLWAMEGLKRLQKRGHFEQTASGLQMSQDLGDLSSTVSRFIREECETGPRCRVPRIKLYDEWKLWCMNNGHKPGSTTTFKNDLESVLPDMKEIRERTPEGRFWYYSGIALGQGDKTAEANSDFVF